MRHKHALPAVTCRNLLCARSRCAATEGVVDVRTPQKFRLGRPTPHNFGLPFEWLINCITGVFRLFNCFLEISDMSIQVVFICSLINATADFYFLVYPHVVVCKAFQHFCRYSPAVRPIFHLKMHRNLLAAKFRAPQTLRLASMGGPRKGKGREER